MEVFGQKVIRDFMPDQHRAFYQQLPFLVAAAVDAAGTLGRRCSKERKASSARPIPGNC